MYLLTLFRDDSHEVLVRADRYQSMRRMAYFLGVERSDLYNWLHHRTKPRGILKFVEIKHCSI